MNTVRIYFLKLIAKFLFLFLLIFIVGVCKPVCKKSHVKSVIPIYKNLCRTIQPKRDMGFWLAIATCSTIINSDFFVMLCRMVIVHN